MMRRQDGRTVVIATRGSALATTQTEIVRRELMAAVPGLAAEIIKVTTRGDTNVTTPLSVIGGKGIFVVELEDALRSGRADMAVHSAKDLPSTLASDMRIAAFLARGDVRDVLVSNSGKLDELPAGSRVGTSSPRRAALVRSVRPDVITVEIRGNVDTRLRKLRAGEFDAIVLAAAGLIRLGLESHITEWFDPSAMIPSPGQGALAIEVATARADISQIVAAINDSDCEAAVTAERAFLRAFGGGCSAPIGAYAAIADSGLTLYGMAGTVDGVLLRETAKGELRDAESIGTKLAARLRESGASFASRPGQSSGY